MLQNLYRSGQFRKEDILPDKNPDCLLTRFKLQFWSEFGEIFTDPY